MVYSKKKCMAMGHRGGASVEALKAHGNGCISGYKVIFSGGGCNLTVIAIVSFFKVLRKLLIHCTVVFILRNEKN